jgi:hypothetical protein
MLVEAWNESCSMISFVLPLKAASCMMEKVSLLITFLSLTVAFALDAPDACVTICVYNDLECNGAPLREMTFPTWSEPGSPCCKSSHQISIQYFSLTYVPHTWQTMMLHALTCRSIVSGATRRPAIGTKRSLSAMNSAKKHGLPHRSI